MTEDNFGKDESHEEPGYRSRGAIRPRALRLRIFIRSTTPVTNEEPVEDPEMSQPRDPAYRPEY